MIKVEHENGYTGILYGNKSMSIIKDGKEVLHTGSRSKTVNTEDDLYRVLTRMPNLFKMMSDVADKAFNEEEEEL